jgi:S1-C subfamily serine protease
VADETLRVVAGKASGTEIKLDGEFVIGRASEGDGTLGDDPELSRSHARIIRRAGDQLSIEDLGSTNGTYVNGRRVEGPTKLRPGDTIKVGMTTLQLLDAAGKAPQTTALGSSPVKDEGATAVARQAPTAAPPAPGGSPASAVPPPATPTRPAPPPGGPPKPPPHPATARAPRGRGRNIALGLIGLLVLGGAIVGVVLLAGDDSDEPEVLTPREIVSENSGAVARIDTRGPARDDDGNRITASGGGSGIVVDARRGMVLTNAHVVSGQTSINVTVNGEELNAAVLGQAPCEDLAVLELRPRPSGLKGAELGTTRNLRAGDHVTALGYPGAFEQELTERKLQATDGTVSSGVTSGSLGDALPQYPALIQHQAPISPGNSGGPLFNDRGQVVGVNAVGLGGAGTGQENQNGAIAVDRAKAVLRDLTANRDSGYVGWNLLPVRGDELGFLFVQGVDPDSPADRANLAYGDAIFEVDDTPVATVADVCDIVGSKSSGDRLKIAGISTPTRLPFTVRARLP